MSSEKEDNAVFTRELMWGVVEFCIMMVISSMMSTIVDACSTKDAAIFNSIFRAVLALIISVWFVGKLRKESK